IQHFITDSPWSAKSVFYTIQKEIACASDLAGGMLSLDESGDEKTSTYSAGVKRQYFGRAGKVEMWQVGVALSYSKGHAFWTMVDAELFLPESEFPPFNEEKRKRTKVPSERVFQTKIELGFDMIQQARRNGLPFSIVSFDTLYGRNIQFRADLYQHGYLYMGAVPCSQKIYLQKPIVGVPSSNGRKGKKFTKKTRVISCYLYRSQRMGEATRSGMDTD
ncbi:transposase, partial [Bacillus mycoides]|uniref:transposase n=1 Tax=Bacillus mycoides TaxID=1405 RepID=UPI003D646312